MKNILFARGIQKSSSSIRNYLKEMKYSYKRVSLQPAGRNSVENIAVRKRFCLNLYDLNPKKLIFLDECGFNQHTCLNYGWGLPGRNP